MDSFVPWLRCCFLILLKQKTDYNLSQSAVPKADKSMRITAFRFNVDLMTFVKAYHTWLF